jgi:hypothetical protein
MFREHAAAELEGGRRRTHFIVATTMAADVCAGWDVVSLGERRGGLQGAVFVSADANAARFQDQDRVLG